MCFFALLVCVRGTLLFLAFPWMLVAIPPAILSIMKSLTLGALGLSFVFALGVVMVVMPTIIAVFLLTRA